MIPAIFLALFAVSANAETLHLKDGSVLHGTIKKADADVVEIQTQDGVLEIKKDRIVNIDYTAPQDTSAPLSEIPSADSSSPAAPETKRLPAQIQSPAQDSNSNSLNEISVNVGGFAPLARLTIQGQDDLAGPGIAFGARYLRQANPNVAFGIGIEKLTGGMHNSLTLIDHLFTSSQFDSLTVMGLARLSAAEGTLRPYIIGGLGAHSSTIKIDSFPQPGFVWANTGTVESRNVIDSTKSAAAFMLEAGLNAILSDSISLGAGAAYYYMGAANYDASPAAKQLGLAGINQALAGVIFSGNLNFRF